MFAILFCISSFASEKKIEKNVGSVLPEAVVKIIENSDSVSWCLLDPNAPDSVCNSYARIGECLMEVPDTCEDRVNAMKATLTYSKSFENKTISKDCTYLPDLACVFYSSNGSLTFSYSFYCDLCRFECEGTKKEYDGELVRDAIIQIALEIFPKDRYLRRIAGKTR